MSKSLECGLLDLLDLGQLQSHSFKLNMEYFSLQDVIDQAINIIGFKAVQAKVEIVPPALRKVDKNKLNRIWGDPQRYV